MSATFIYSSKPTKKLQVCDHWGLSKHILAYVCVRTCGPQGLCDSHDMIGLNSSLQLSPPVLGPNTSVEFH